MPRPTAAQLAYGSATVVFSTLALLLFTRTTEGIGVAAIGVASMALGLLVAVAMPLSRNAARAARTAEAARTVRRDHAAASELSARVPAARAHVGAETRVSEHSLRR
ncbi:hypothetical protein [Streptomyces sp. NPDC020681]|uniref:hypothetical protein n=1 Tax=Streptomyces sp. NPDC020681 TaxID=3365083 RepID=UPI0037AB26DA